MLEQLVQFIQDQVANNELFQGGLLLMVGGALLALVRAWPGRIWEFIKRQSMIVIDIPDKDQAFHWVNLWLANHNYSKHRARLLTVKTEHTNREFDKPKIIFSPAPGNHWLWYRRRLMILNRNRQQMGGDDGPAVAGMGHDPFREYFTIRLIGRNRNLALELIQEAYDFSHPHTVDKIAIHRSRNYGDWLSNTWALKRSLESVILPDNLLNELVSDIQTFLDSEEWYMKRSLPYRRGYLFYGSPGNGKTSAIMALASRFKLDIAILNIKSTDMSDDDLSDALINTPQSSIILIEDIDCILSGRRTRAKITFSGLLNALDGVSARHGQLVFMTTNFRDRLDEALIRPGRCDVQKEFPNANADQKFHLFEQFFPSSNLALSFSERASGNMSMAELQKHMMEHRDDPQAALEYAANIEDEAKMNVADSQGPVA